MLFIFIVSFIFCLGARHIYASAYNNCLGNSLLLKIGDTERLIQKQLAEKYLKISRIFLDLTVVTGIGLLVNLF